MNYLNTGNPSAKYINDVKSGGGIGAILTAKRGGASGKFQASSQVARNHEKIIFLKNNIMTEWK